MSRPSARLGGAATVVRLDGGVYLARAGRWRLVHVGAGRWWVTDTAGRYNAGEPEETRSLYAARRLIGIAEATPEGRRP